NGRLAQIQLSDKADLFQILEHLVGNGHPSHVNGPGAIPVGIGLESKCGTLFFQRSDRALADRLLFFEVTLTVSASGGDKEQEKPPGTDRRADLARSVPQHDSRLIARPNADPADCRGFRLGATSPDLRFS